MSNSLIELIQSLFSLFRGLFSPTVPFIQLIFVMLFVAGLFYLIFKLCNH